MLTTIKKGLINVLFKFLYLFDVQKDKILITSYWGKGFGDNGKAIVLALKELGKNYEIYWAVNKSEFEGFPDFVKPIRYLSFKYFYHLATARIWIDNSRKGTHAHKRDGQFYIQTWHGDPMLKKIEQDAEETLDKFYVNWAKQDSSLIDLVLANSDFGVKFFRNSFWYNGKIYKSGLPRLDILQNKTPEYVTNIKEKLGINSNKQILLYAPTFRKDHNLSCYAMDYLRLHNALAKKFGGDWVILIRLHPNMTKEESELLNVNYNEWLLNVTQYKDMYELLTISDILITDYSSTMFEAASVNIPVFLYATDYSKYLNERGVYFEFNELPFPVAYTYDSLIKCIEQFNQEDYQKFVQSFCQRLGVVKPGSASYNVAQCIINVIENKRCDFTD